MFTTCLKRFISFLDASGIKKLENTLCFVIFVVLFVNKIEHIGSNKKSEKLGTKCKIDLRD